MYELNGYTYSLEEIQEAAARDGMSLQDFINKKGLKPTKDHQQKIDNKGEPNGFQKIINGIGDYFLGQDGDMATAWNNGKILREAYDGINEAFNIDTDDPNYSLTPEQAQAFYNSLKSRGNMEEVEAMNAWNKTFDETVEKDRKLVEEGKADDWGEVGRNFAAGIYSTIKHGPGSLLSVLAQSFSQGLDDDILIKSGAAGTTAAGAVAVAGQAGPQA